jgi:hypothetical protein
MAMVAGPGHVQSKRGGAPGLEPPPPGRHRWPCPGVVPRPQGQSFESGDSLAGAGGHLSPALIVIIVVTLLLLLLLIIIIIIIIITPIP